MLPKSFRPVDYPRYLQNLFTSRWLPQSLWLEFMQQWSPGESMIKREVFAYSTEGRAIEQIIWGEGEKKVLIWSQMHGNEPTGTMALADLLVFLCSDDDYNELRQFLRNELCICFVPILNPDGAQRFHRQNAKGIDLNRDARRQSTPEMIAFMQLIRGLKPSAAFNLHDQRNIFSAGNFAKPASISFLSASSDESRSVTPVRARAMELIASMYQQIAPEIPSCIGRYSDEFYPRATGDYLHSVGIPCVLIESGAAINDDLRLVARKMNFLAILEGLRCIAGSLPVQDYQKIYHQIPENRELYYDLILREVRFNKPVDKLVLDIALLVKEQLDEESGKLLKTFVVNEIGDLSYHFGLSEFNNVSLQFDQWPRIDKPANFKVLKGEKLLLDFQEGHLNEKH